MKKFRGVFPAIVAPQDDKNEILFDVMGDLAKRQVADGAGGFLVNGHTGELSLLSGDERREAIKTVRAAVGGAVPILAGIHTQGLGRKFAAQCESAAECGADAILMFSPFSFARGAFQYAPEAVVDDALGRLSGACDSLRTIGQVLVLRMPPTFTSRWFLPLLPELRALLPNVDVRITTYDSWEPEFERSDVDAAVVMGRDDAIGVGSVALMPEVLTPMCSPQLAARIGSPADLLTLPLLHCDPRDAWRRWLQSSGVDSKDSRRGQTFDTLDLALVAATRGQGVAMGDLNLVRESLRDGILVAPFALTVERGVSYYLVYPPDRAQQPKIRALREWLTECANRN